MLFFKPSLIIPPSEPLEPQFSEDFAHHIDPPEVTLFLQKLSSKPRKERKGKKNEHDCSRKITNKSQGNSEKSLGE